MKRGNNKVLFKLGLDLILMILLVMLYQKNIINLMFHETAGLCLLGLFIVHVIWNRKWIVGITKRMFSRKLSGKARFLYILNFLLGISFFLCGLSGIFISKKIFSFHLTAVWIPLHFFFAALSILIVGIHLGFHFTMIHNTLFRAVPRTVSLVLAAVVVIAGLYSYSNSSMSRWLKAPFSTQGEAMHNQMPENGEMMHREGWSDDSSDGSSEKGNQGEGKKNYAMKEGKQAGRDGNKEFSAGSLIKLMVEYGSILLTIAIFTAAIMDVMRTVKKRKQIVLFQEGENS